MARRKPRKQLTISPIMAGGVALVVITLVSALVLALGGLDVAELFSRAASATGEGVPRPSTDSATDEALEQTHAPTMTPASGFEQARDFAEPILAAIEGRPPDYEDDFSNPATGWRQGAIPADPEHGTGGQLAYADGVYVVTADEARERPDSTFVTCAWGETGNMPSLSDFALEVEVQLVDAEAGNYDGQVHFRSTYLGEVTRRYEASFTTDGELALQRNDGGDVQILGRWSGPPLRPGPETNLVQIIAIGPDITIYANGQPVLSVTDPGFSDEFASGIVTFQNCNKADVPTAARFDNLRIWDISDVDVPVTTAAANLIDTDAPPDQHRQLTSCATGLCIVDSQGSSTPVIQAGTYVGIDGYSWSPDGQRIVFSACHVDNTSDPKCRRVYVADVTGESITPLQPGSTRHELVPAWSPDGQWIAYHDDGSLSVVRPDGTPYRSGPHNICPSSIAWSPDSRRIAFTADMCTGDETVAMWVTDLDDSDAQLLHISDDPPLERGALAWAPDGKSIALTLANGLSYLIDADCDSGPNGCDASAWTSISAIPEHWLDTYLPQWAGEDVAR